MTPVTTFAGKRVALFGLGGSGLVTAKALVAGGARVLADDDREASKANAREQGIEVGDLKTADWSGFSALILTPGVPLTHPRPHWSVDLAALAGIEVIGDIELFSRERQKLDPQAPLIAITGTNGKSTTTALIAHILRQAHREVAMGGNIGTAILALDPPSRGRIHVVECSSYQIDLAPSLRPSVGMMLNLSPDHLDRHGTMENYAAIKQRLVAASDLAVIGVDDRMSSAMADAVEGQGVRVARVSTRRAVADGVYAEGTRILAASAGAAEPVADIAGIGSLRGRHNAENAAAAFAACRAVGLDAAEIARGLASFPGLPHRMEEVGRLGRVLFVNDSKATNADAAARALSSFEAIHWIAGGQAKEGGIAPLAEFFPHVAKAYLVGEAAPDFAATLGETVPHVVSGEIARALEQASRDAAGSAAAQPVVLLSPACASFDQFRSFEHRGDVFRALVKDLLAKTGRTS